MVSQSPSPSEVLASNGPVWPPAHLRLLSLGSPSVRPLTLHPTGESLLCFWNLLNPQLRTSFLLATVSAITPAGGHTKCLTHRPGLLFKDSAKAASALAVDISVRGRMPSWRCPSPRAGLAAVGSTRHSGSGLPGFRPQLYHLLS